MAAREVNYFPFRAQLFSRPVLLVLPPPEPTIEPPRSRAYQVLFLKALPAQRLARHLLNLFARHGRPVLFGNSPHNKAVEVPISRLRRELSQ